MEGLCEEVERGEGVGGVKVEEVGLKLTLKGPNKKCSR